MGTIVFTPHSLWICWCLCLNYFEMLLPLLHKINGRSEVWARCHLLKKTCITNFSITAFSTIWNYFVCLLVCVFVFCLLLGEYILLKRRNLIYLVFCSVPACRTVCYVYTYMIYIHHIVYSSNCTGWINKWIISSHIHNNCMEYYLSH